MRVLACIQLVSESGSDMADDNFEAGDTVMLKSGGPVMTVEEVEGTDVYAVWFDKNQEKRDMFQKATLRRYDGPGGV